MIKNKRLLHRALLFLVPIMYAVLVLSLVKIGDNYLRTQTKTTTSLSYAKQVVAADKEKKAYYTDELTNVDARELLSGKQNNDQVIAKTGVGRLSIPAVDISLPILVGRNDQTLSTGAATYWADEQAGKDNYILAAHNFIGANVLLKGIARLTLGELIYVSDATHIYTYKVALNRVVNKKEVQYIDPKSERPIITLLRCEGRLGTVNRRVVQGKLVKTQLLNRKTIKTHKSLGITATPINHKNWLDQFKLQLARVAAQIQTDFATGKLSWTSFLLILGFVAALAVPFLPRFN
ncbi:class A sortase [Lapidilactobacillus mulanensis]|uniref:Class A sortase n=1 Tax=Lapidilactobacillus mulanensis TaxID=2485999 RepID=A0ABW4DN28_9LACO|nr:class A sortase [Lapidilactobacillus mulanensis]